MEITSLSKLKNYIQIGAGAGDQDSRADYRDGFTEFVKKINPKEIGRILLVEPNPINIQYLNKCWENYSEKSEIFQIGICTSDKKDNSIKFYYSVEDAPNFQTCSMNIEHVLAHYPNTSQIKTIDVYCMTLTDFIQKTLGDEKIELLSLDIEGIDDLVILDTDWSNINCNMLSIEHLHMSTETMIRVRQHLAIAGFHFVGSGMDVRGYDSLFKKDL